VIFIIFSCINKTTLEKIICISFVIFFIESIGIINFPLQSIFINLFITFVDTICFKFIFVFLIIKKRFSILFLIVFLLTYWCSNLNEFIQKKKVKSNCNCEKREREIERMQLCEMSEITSQNIFSNEINFVFRSITV